MGFFVVAAFQNAIKDLNPARMLQKSMDGPAKIFKMLRMVMDSRNHLDPSKPKLLELGSCSLHIIHGAFYLAWLNSA